MKNRIIFILSVLIFIAGCKEKKTVSESKNSEIGQFRFVISDTLAYGKNLARIAEYNRELKENETTLISVIIENELEDGTTKIDTFSDGLKTPFFGISKYKTGKHEIEIKIEEKMMRTKSPPNDSISLEIKDIYYTYDFNVFVMDKEYESELNEILKKQMKIEYNQNPIK